VLGPKLLDLFLGLEARQFEQADGLLRQHARQHADGGDMNLAARQRLDGVITEQLAARDIAHVGLPRRRRAWATADIASLTYTVAVLVSLITKGRPARSARSVVPWECARASTGNVTRLLLEIDRHLQ
jgi:hypothetical protein